jgi:hypothetical protein
MALSINAALCARLTFGKSFGTPGSISGIASPMRSLNSIPRLCYTLAPISR